MTLWFLEAQESESRPNPRTWDPPLVQVYGLLK
jgi:hypothetical protein